MLKNIRFKCLFFILLFFIIIFSALTGGLTACSTLMNQNTGSSNEIITENPQLLNTNIQLNDLNNGDIYPGDSLEAVITIKNTGDSDAGKITVEINFPSILTPENPVETFKIDSIKKGEEKVYKIPFKVIGQLEKDTNGFLNLTINKGTGKEYESDSLIFAVFGVAPYKRGEIPIIGLHAIEDKIEIPIELSTYNFDILCKCLKQFGFETITFTDLLNHIDYGRVLPEKSVIITSDDGFADLYENAFPVLKKYDYKMTVFLVTDFVKDSDAERVTNYFDENRGVPMRPLLIWPEVKEMDEYGCEFLSHSANHIHLGLASEEEFTEELIKSKEDIESHLGKSMVFFAWPYDNNDPKKLNLLSELDYRGAVRYWGGIENMNSIDLKDIKRVEFNSLVSPDTYATYLILHSISIEGKIKDKQLKKDDEFILEYTIRNSDKTDLKISSFELELPDNIGLEALEKGSYLSQYPGLKDKILMWVGDNYEIKAGSEINIKLRLISKNAGASTVKFRITAYGGYINSEDIELEIN